jgi:hypothetical protein
MRGLSACLALVLCASPVSARQRGPIRTSIEQTAASARLNMADATSDAATDDASPQLDVKSRARSRQKGALFWSGLAVGVAGVTTTTLGLTTLRTERTSTGNAPDETYRNCVAQKESNPIYATNQCGALKGKNLKLLWGGVAVGGAGAALMLRGRNTSAELAPGAISVSHRWRF